MTKLIITRGYPASGKTTWAVQHAARPGWGRVNRDDLRAMMFNYTSGLLEPAQEAAVTRAQRAQVEALLRSGTSVVVDDTNLKLRYARDWATLAAKLGIEFECVDFPTSVDECVRRDQKRGNESGRTVGEAVIRAKAARYPINRWEPVTPYGTTTKLVARPYLPDPQLPSAYIVDLDGTLALMGDRDPYDFHRVGEDEPNPGVVAMTQELENRHQILVVSGRSALCYDASWNWLIYKANVQPHKLFMRAEHDHRPDSIVKLEIFDTHIRPHYNVRGVFDDRASVCRLWHQLGVPLFRVGDPDQPEF